MDSVLREVWNAAEERYDDINISPFTRHLTGSVYHTCSVLYDPLRIFNSTKHVTVSTPSSQNMYWNSLQHLSLRQFGNSSSLVTECMSTPACITETANYTSHSPLPSSLDAQPQNLPYSTAQYRFVVITVPLRFFLPLHLSGPTFSTRCDYISISCGLPDSLLPLER